MIAKHSFDNKLPKTYRRFLAEGWIECVDEITFSPVDMVEKLNELGEVLEALPGHMLVGSDGGSNYYLVELNGAEDSPVYRADSEALGKGVVQISESFGEWPQAGCPLPVDEDDKFDMHVIVPVFFDVTPTKVETLALIRATPTADLLLELRKITQRPLGELKRALTEDGHFLLSFGIVTLTSLEQRTTAWLSFRKVINLLKGKGLAFQVVLGGKEPEKDSRQEINAEQVDRIFEILRS